MGWEYLFEHMRDYGHTWGPGIDDYVEPTDEEILEDNAGYGAYLKELSVLRVSAREKYIQKGEELKATLPSSHDITFGNAPYNWREDYSTAKMELCKEAAEDFGHDFGLMEYSREQKNEFLISVERYGFLPERGGNIHRYAVKGIKDPMECLQLVADFESVGCSPTTYWFGTKTRMDIFPSISETDTGRLYKEMESWGVSFDKKGLLDKEIRQLAVELDQFVYDFDTYAYNDAVDDREQALVELEKNIRTGEVEHIKAWHEDITLDEHDWDTVLESRTLMKWMDRVEDKIKKEQRVTIDDKISGAESRTGNVKNENNKQVCKEMEI